MSAFRAVGKGLAATGRFWFAIPGVVIAYSAISALATVLLPFTLVDGKLQVPPPTNPPEAFSRLVVGMALFLSSLAFSLYWLGGTVLSTRLILQGETVSQRDFFDAAGRELFRMFRWALTLTSLAMGLGLLVAAPLGVLWAATGRSSFMKALIQLGFTVTILFVGISFMFSPMILLERGQSVWSSFKDSWRFSHERSRGILGLISGIVGVGVVVWMIGLVLAGGIGQLRQMMGIAPFAKGWPVFFFGLILGLPQAFLTLFIPAALTAYHWGSSRPS